MSIEHATHVGSHGQGGAGRYGKPDRCGRGDQGRETEMASTPMVRADAFALLPSILVLLMLVLASLGIVAHAATL